MSTRQFTLEYIIKVTGGGTAGAQINQLNNQLKATGPAAKQTAAGFTQIEQSSHRAGAAITRTTSHMKGIAFGLIGLTSAGVEAIGMLGMWQDTARRTSEAQEELNEATRTYGEDSHQARQATQELTKAQRFQAMTQRNLILSMFDMVPFTLLLVNGIREQIILTKELNALRGIEAAVTNTSTAATTRFTAAKAAESLATATSTGAFQRNTIALGAGTAATNIATQATSRFAIAGTLLNKVLLPITLILGALAAAAIAYQTNFGGLRDTFDNIGVSIGKAVPQLTGFLNKIKDLALAFPDLGKMKDVLFGGKEGKDLTKMSEELTKALAELDKQAGELIQTLASADKGERNDLFSAMGIKGGAEKRFKPILNDIEKMTNIVTGFGQSMQLMRKINILEKIGFDIPDSLTKKMAFTFEDRFREIGKMLGKEKGGLFGGLADVLEQNAKKGSTQISQAVGKYILDHPGIIAALNAIGLPDVATQLKAMADEEAHRLKIMAAQNKSSEVEVVGDKALGLVTKAGEEAAEAAEWKARGERLMAAFESGLIPTAATLANKLRLLILDPLLVNASIVGANIIDFIRQGIASRSTGSFWGDISQAGAAAESDSNEVMSQLLFGKTYADVKVMFENYRSTLGIHIRVWFTNLKETLDTAWKDAQTTVNTLVSENPILGPIADFLFPKGDVFSGLDLTSKLMEIIAPLFNIKAWQDAVNRDVARLQAIGSTILEGIKSGIWAAITSVFPVDEINKIVDQILSLFQVQTASGYTGTTPTPTNTGVDKVPANEDWSTWQMNVDEKVGFVWTKLTAFINYLNTSFTVTIPVALQASQTALANFAIQGANSLSIGEVAAQGLQTGLANLSNQGIKSMNALAKASSTMANGIKNNMAVAVKAVNGLKDAINSLKSKTVTVSVKVSNSKALGGIMSFAQGGMMSAAAGRIFKASGTQQITVGDNPGRNETIAFIPHNKPSDIMNRLNDMFGHNLSPRSSVGFGGGSGRGGECYTINVYLDGQQIKGKIVKMIASNQSTYK